MNLGIPPLSLRLTYSISAMTTWLAIYQARQLHLVSMICRSSLCQSDSLPLIRLHTVFELGILNPSATEARYQ